MAWIFRGRVLLQRFPRGQAFIPSVLLKRVRPAATSRKALCCLLSVGLKVERHLVGVWEVCKNGTVCHLQSCFS